MSELTVNLSFALMTVSETIQSQQAPWLAGSRTAAVTEVKVCEGLTLSYSIRILCRQNESKSWFFEKIKIAQPLGVLSQAIRIRNERGDSTADLSEMKGIIKIL